MAKVSGIPITVFSVDDSGGVVRDIKNDINAFGISQPRSVQDVTGLDNAGFDRLLLLADIALDLDVFLNTAANRSHDVFKTVLTTDVARTCTITFAGITLAPEIKFTDYNITRDGGGAVTIKTPGVLTGGAVPAWA
jgi:hypothetical protein